MNFRLFCSRNKVFTQSMKAKTEPTVFFMSIIGINFSKHRIFVQLFDTMTQTSPYTLIYFHCFATLHWHSSVKNNAKFSQKFTNLY